MTTPHHTSLIEYLRGRINGEGIVAACIRSDQLDLLQMLLKLGLPAGEHEEYGMSALSLAANTGKLAAAALLLAWGANVHGTDFEDATPLAYAIERDDIQLASLLLAHGATLDYRPSSEGSSARKSIRSEQMRSLLATFGFPTGP